jgi:DNA-binding CsgD family transcriptional regulator
MNKSTCIIFLNCCFWGFVLAVLFTCCQTKTAPNSTTEAPPEMERLLLSADTLSTEAMTAEARKLPGTWVDTFFHSRYLALTRRQDGPSLKAAMLCYEKIRPKNEAAGAFINFCRGVAYQYATQFDSAEIRYKLAQEWYEEQNSDKKYQLAVLEGRTGNSKMLGKYDVAITLQYKALKLYENKADQMNMKVNIAQSFLSNGDTVKPIELLLEPIRFFEESRDTSYWTQALTIQANVFARKNDFSKSLELNQKALSLRREIGEKANSLENMHNVARVLGKLGNWQASLDTLSVAEKTLSQINNKQGKAFLQFATGEALFHLNRLPEADVLLLQNLEKCRARKQYRLAWSAANLLSISKKKQGKPSEALDFREQCVAFNDSLFSQEKEKIIHEAAVKYETREKQAEIVALKLEKKLADQRNLLGGGFLLSVVGAGAWFLRYRHRREKALLEKDIATKRLENEVLIATENLNRTTLENNARELELHKAQLEEFTALMLEKNTKIEALQSYKGESVSDVESNSAMQNALNDDDVDALFQSALLTETDWQRFQKHFEKVFPGILNRLRMEYQQLSIAELRLVLLTKMGLKTNEIALFIGISPESVRKLRYRFKKKMGISEEELLDNVEDK